MCIFFLGSQRASFLVSGYGRSRMSKDVISVNSQDKLYLFQTHAGMTNWDHEYHLEKKSLKKISAIRQLKFVQLPAGFKRKRTASSCTVCKQFSFDDMPLNLLTVTLYFFLRPYSKALITADSNISFLILVIWSDRIYPHFSLFTCRYFRSQSFSW